MAAIAIILALLLALLLVGDTHSAIYATDLSSPASIRWQDAFDLSDGDLVFRTGHDLLSRLVLSQGAAPRFSHVGLIVEIEGEMFVVHAIPRDGDLPGGVRLEPLARFVSTANASDVGVYRIKRTTNSSRGRIREYALQQIGKPFDDAFSLIDDERMYCTELVLKAVAAGGIEIGATVPRIRVMLLTEPVVPPDSLRLSILIEPLAPSSAFVRSAVAAAPGAAGVR